MVVIVSAQAKSIPIITFIAPFQLVLAAVIRTHHKWRLFWGWQVSEQSTEHVRDLRELSLDSGVVSVLPGNGILTFFNRVSKLMKAGTVDHGKTRRWIKKKFDQGKGSKKKNRKALIPNVECVWYFYRNLRE
jgi:hypothetical protein